MKVKHITQYLFESYKDAQAKFVQEASEDEVKQYLDTFKQLTNQNKITGQEKDIGYWIKQGWNDFKDFVDKKSEQPSKRDVKKKRVKKDTDSITLYEDDSIFAVVPLTEQSSCYYGKNTNWCTAVVSDRNRFEMYVSAMKFPINVFVTDNESQKIISVVYNLLSDTVDELRDNNNNLIKRPIENYIKPDAYERIIDNLKKNSDKLEKVSEQFRLKTPYNASNYAVAIEEPFPEGEDVIVQSPYALAYYISRVKTANSDTVCKSIAEYLEKGISTEDSPFIDEEDTIKNVQRVLNKYTENNINCVLGDTTLDQVLNMDISYTVLIEYIRENNVLPSIKQFEIILNMELNSDITFDGGIDLPNIEDSIEIIKRLYKNNYDVAPYIEIIKGIDDSQNTLIDTITSFDMKNENVVQEFLKQLDLTSNALIRIIKYGKNGEYIFKYYDFEKLLNAEDMYKAIRMNPQILNVIDNIPDKLDKYLQDNKFDLPHVQQK